MRAVPQRFALVITGQTKPTLTGPLPASQLRQIRPEPPIIRMTGYTAGITPDRIEPVGIRDVLFKPTTFHALGSAAHRR